MVHDETPEIDPADFAYYQTSFGLVRWRQRPEDTGPFELWVRPLRRRWFRWVYLPGGHWEVCTSDRVRRELFGLGDDPWSGPDELATCLSLDEAKAAAERGGIDLFAPCTGTSPDS